MANDYNASINLNTAEAEKGVKNLDAAVGALDKKLASLDSTIRKTQGNLDTVTKSMSELTRANAVLIRSETDRAKATVLAARADREAIINNGKKAKMASDAAISAAKEARIRTQTANQTRSTNGALGARSSESAARIAATNAVGQARVATESVRAAVATENLAASAARAAAAQERQANQSARLAGAQQRAQNSTLALNDSLSNSRYLLYDVGQTYAVLSAALLAIPAATAAVAIAYERDFAQVMRTNMDLEQSGGSFAGLRQELKALATEIPLTFKEFGEITTIGGQLGIAGRDIGAFTETVARFGAASNVTLEEASTAFGRFQQSFEVSQGKNTEDYFNKLGSAIAYVGVKSAASEKEIIAVANQIAAAGSQFNFATEDIVGLSGALASVRIRPEMARGAFQRVLLGLSSAADDGAESFDHFAKYTDVAGQAAIDLFKSNPSEFFHQYIGGIKNAIAVSGSVSTVMDDIGAKNVFDKQFILGLANGYDVFTQSLENSSQAFGEGTFLSKSTEGVFNTVDAKLKRIANSIKNLSDTIAKGSLEGLSGIADSLMHIVGAADRFAQATPGFSTFVNLTLGLGTAVGILLAFKSAQAFVLAGLVGFQQVLGKTSIAAGLTLKGNMQELAKTMLMTKGVTAAAAGEFVRNAGAMRAMGASATMTATQIRALNAGLGTAGVTAGTTATRVGIASLAMKGFGTALSLVGGPIGALLLGLGSIALGFIQAEEKAASAGDAIARAMNNGQAAGKQAIAEALNDRTVDSWNTDLGSGGLGNHGKNIRELAKQIDISFDDIVNSIAQGEDASKAFGAVLDEYSKKRGFADYADLQAKSMTNLVNNKGELQLLERIVGDLSAKSAKSAADQEAAAKASGQVGAAAGAAGPAVDDFADGLNGVGDEAETAEEKIDKFINTIFGLANAEVATQEALASLGEGIANSTDFGVDTEGGRNNISNFRDTLRSAIMEQQYLIESTGKTIQQASADYNAFVDGLVRELGARGVDPVAIMEIANQSKGFFQAGIDAGPQPKVKVQADTASVLGTATALPQTLQQYIQNQRIPTIAVDAETTPAQSKVLGLANNLAAITGLPYQAVVDALTDPANEKSKQVYELLTSITNGTYVAPVNADTSAAVANVQNFLAFARTELAHLQADLNNGIGLADGEGSMSPAQKAQYANLGAPMQVSTPAAAAPAPVIPQASSPVLATPNFGGLANGYDKVKDAAEKAGEKGKKAAEDMANGIDDATRAADDYANRLRQGLQSAFDKQYAMATAADAYHTALNAINQKREDELKQIDDLITKQKELNNSRKEDLVTARKAGIEKAISQKYGETDRAMDYASQEQTALDNAAAKQKDIDATVKQRNELQAGIGKLTGYSQAAIENRAALRDLESKMLDMVSAYASTGKSVDQVRAYAAKMTGQFQRDVTQIGYNRTAIANLQGNLSRYIGVVKSVPAVKPTKVTADTGAANNAINGVRSNLNSIPSSKTSTVYVKTVKTTENHVRGGVMHTESRMKDGSPIYRVVNPDGTGTNLRIYNKGGQVQGFASGGLIPGKAPSNPAVDNLLAQVDGRGIVRVRSEEFIMQQPAVDYWGLDFMNALNSMKMPQFNSGGSVGGARGGSASGDAMLVELTAEAIAAIQRMPPIILTTENRVIAQSANDGNTILATQGAN